MKLLITLFCLAALSRSGFADNKDRADSLFKQGKKLMAEKRYADACEAFEKSFKLDPGIGAQLNVAKCYEEWGRIGRALVAYRVAEKLAKDAKDPREGKIHALVVELEPNVPYLTIKVPKDAPSDLQVTLDSRPVDSLDEAFPIDPGAHTIEWSVAGGAKKSKVVPIERGGETEITLELPKSPTEKPVGTGEPVGDGGAGDKAGDKPGDKLGGSSTATAAPSTPGRAMRLGGIAMGGLGLVAFGVSGYVTLSARSKYNDALDMYCGGMPNNCDMMGREITADARSAANKATVVFVIGAALVGGGVALYLLAPRRPAAAAQERSAVYLTPAVSSDGVGVVLGGTL